MKIIEKLRAVAKAAPSIAYDIAGGGAGMIMQAGTGKSAAGHLLSGEVEEGVRAMSISYLGFDPNAPYTGIGNMAKKAKGTQAAIISQIFKSVYNDIKEG